MTIYIICDGFRIGGIERLALDQAYFLRDNGVQSEILVLGNKPRRNEHIFKRDESELIRRLKVSFKFIPGSRLQQYFRIKSLVKINKDNFFISHSLRGSVLLCLIRFFGRHDFRMTTTIHQLPSLSAPIQRFRRMIYSQFTDKLFFFSDSAASDWNFRRKRNILIYFLSNRRKTFVCRNGVYLPRLPNISKKSFSANLKIQRLVFIGRVTTWKGLDTFLNIAKHPMLSSLKILVVVPSIPINYLDTLDPFLKNRVIFSIGKSISKVNFHPGDLLIYPTNYGEKSLFIEGISINVLEMACLGVPSIITKNGNLTWPELKEVKLVYEVDWLDIDAIVNLIINQIKVPNESTIRFCRRIIDISHNMEKHLNIMVD